MKKLALCATAAALVGGALLSFAPLSVSAAALPNSAVAAPADSTLIEKVDNHKRKHRERRHRRDDRHHRKYDSHRHGSRYRYARPGFGYYYDGYYYGSPWWIGPSVGFTVTVPPPVIPYGHVQWCLDNFRTYDVGSDTYIGYDGYRHRCNSPF